MSLKTPIAFCIFNRPEKTQRVFDVIARMRPRRLLVIADGPRRSHESDVELVSRTRAILQQVDWSCSLLTNYSDHNLGCRQRMATGLTWAFQMCPELIVLEDDCLPDESFFGYCESLLERYRDDQRIMMISGDNFQPRQRSDYSYYFSRWPHIWGWASWRRAWNKFAVDIPDWPVTKQSPGFRGQFLDERDFRHWSQMFDRVHRGEIDTWDFSWAYACWANNGLTVLPEKNLVSNIGFDAAATHTTDPSSVLADLGRSRIDLPLKHPATIQPNIKADRWTLQNIFRPSTESESPKLTSNRQSPWRRWFARRKKEAA